MDSVFLATHEYENAAGCECLKIIGVFATEEEARAAVNHVRDKEGFRDHPDGFAVGPVKLGSINWTAGFISWKEALDAIPGTEVPEVRPGKE